MIKTNTLFILGAGASSPFGYFTSVQLRNAICNRELQHTVVEALTPAYDDPGWYSRSYDKFVDEFSKSSLYSIDFFLEHRTEFMRIGKMAIAAHLIQFENEERLRDSDGNWYMYLYDRLKSSFDDFDNNAISFITFNYDRSLEQFLFEAIRARFDKSSDECGKKLKNIPIVHLYGQLDSLIWQDRNGMPYVPEDGLIHRIKGATKNIKLISDERDINKSLEFQKAYKLIENAQKIYFLGFGFDETNLERLNITLMKGKSIRATALGLEPSRQRWAKRYFGEKASTILHFFENVDSLSLLQKDLEIE